MSERKYGGNTGTPVEIQYPRASVQRQTTEDRSRTRQHITRQHSVDGENEDAWKQPKQHTSAVRLDYPRRKAPKDAYKTQLMRERRLDRYTLMIVVSLIIIVMVGGWIAFNAVANWWTNTTNDWKYGNPRTF
jgi:ferric-dicitrate binding protein FerR (iron transport regulator)